MRVYFSKRDEAKAFAAQINALGMFCEVTEVDAYHGDMRYLVEIK
jgi:hypothetical protein